MSLHLVRHPPVAKSWQKHCYGQSDPGLSREGSAMIRPLVDQLSALEPSIIIHSDMARTRAIAVPLAKRIGMKSIADPLWQERDFGEWEGQTWNAIYRASGNAMDGMIDAPSQYRPGGGETTDDLLRRTERALSQLPRLPNIIVIAHGGTIACAQQILQGGDITDLPTRIPPTGAIVSIHRP